MRPHLVLGQHLLRRRSCGAGDQRGCRGCASFVLSASITAVLHFIPVFGPLLAPFKGEAASLAGFRFKTILNLCYASHGVNRR